MMKKAITTALIFLPVLLQLSESVAATSDLETEDVRAISLAPHLTELVFTAGAGHRLVGVVEWSDYPPTALDIPRIGDAFRFDIERIVALDTSHALAWTGGTPMAAIQQLESLGIEVIQVQTRTLDEIAQALQRIGQTFGSAETADRAAAEFIRQRDALASAREDTIPVPVFYQVSERPLFTLGGRHVINEVFALCGAHNIFADLQIEASVVGREAVITAQPLIIIAGSNAPSPTADSLDPSWPEHPPLGHWQSFDLVPAVACGYGWVVDPALLVRPTPRILDGARQLCEWLDHIRRNPPADPACRIGHD